MLSLALEFSSARRSAALLASGPDAPVRVIAEISDGGERTPGPLNLVTRLLAQAAVERGAVEQVIVGLGPGSYTGIRSSIAIAQGWHLATGVKLAGASSIEALALQTQDRGWFGRILIAIDAQRNELYLAEYVIEAERRQISSPLRIVPAAELRERAARPDMLSVGPEITRWHEAGRLLHPLARDVGKLALQSGAPDAARLEPIYLRETTFVKMKRPDCGPSPT